MLAIICKIWTKQTEALSCKYIMVNPKGIPVSYHTEGTLEGGNIGGFGELDI